METFEFIFLKLHHIIITLEGMRDLTKH